MAAAHRIEAMRVRRETTLVACKRMLQLGVVQRSARSVEAPATVAQAFVTLRA
jgi:hypothetical protein